MKKNLLNTFIILISSIFVSAQNSETKIERQLIEYFQEYNWNKLPITKDSLYSCSFTKDKFYISLSKAPIEFDTSHIVIINPYFSDKYEESEDEKVRVKNFPKSYSVIYLDKLIALFENGKFVCYNLESFVRDTVFENKLNTKKFDYHWIIGNKLGALSKGSIYIWNDNEWIINKDEFPLKGQPKLFEDNEFIVFGDCHGEWGGTVYFSKKLTQKYIIRNLLVPIQ